MTHERMNDKIIRRRAFAYDVRFGSLEQAQCHLDKVCDRLNGEIGRAHV